MFSVHNVCRQLFTKLAFQIAKRPKVFVVVPIIFSTLLSCGILRFNYINDAEYLFTLSKGQAKHDAQVINSLFPNNSTRKFSPSRMTSPGRYARLIVQRKDGQSIINSDTWTEILALDYLIQDISINWGNKDYNYSKLCATWNGDCYQNTHLGLGTIINQIVNGSLRFSYPVMFNPINFEIYPVDIFFGGVELIPNTTSTVQSVKAVGLDYFLRDDTHDNQERGILWEAALLDQMAKVADRWKILKVDYVTYTSISEEFQRNCLSAIPYAAVTYTLMGILVMASSYTGDRVTSKPLVGLMGIISGTFGICATFGLLCLVGVPFIYVNVAVPFVALGVGIDDTFVMTAAWWKTSRKDTVAQRLAQCYSEAGISITVTTLTDSFSFFVGIWSPIPCLQIFCAYAGTSIFFIYIFQIFFFGALLAISGQWEEEGRHCLFPWKTVEMAHSENEKPENKIVPMEYFRDTFAPFLAKKWTKVSVIVIYFAYLSISIVGIVNMKEGLAYAHVSTYDSYLNSYYNTFDQYFLKYPRRSQVVITTPLDYSDPQIQHKVQEYLTNLTHLEGMTPAYGENWLTDFLRFKENYAEFYNISTETEQDFINALREHYLQDYNVYSNDVKFNENFTKIIASRFVVQHTYAFGGKAEKDLLVKVRELSDSQTFMKVVVFSPFFLLTDVSVIMIEMTLKLVGIACIIVMAVVIFFIPNATTCIFTLLSVISVELGVMGFLGFWDVYLDAITVGALIMCIGFSVDFPAHMIYAYVSSRKETVQERIEETLYGLAFPILQGGISTIIGTTGLIFVYSYIFHVLLKVIFLVMTLSTFNALFVLPVLLMIFKPSSKGD